MRALLLLFAVAGCANNTSPTGDAVLRQIQNVTHTPRKSFSRPGDFTAEAPSPDSGGAIVGDPTCDNASCLPR
jgi:hypothetical protein